MPIRRLADGWLLPVLSCALLAGSGIFLAPDAVGESPVTFVAPEASDGDLLGTAVAVDAGRLLVGASSTDLARDDVGAAYLFSAGGDGAVELAATLAADDGELADAFGAAVAISGDSILIGAPRVMLGELNEGAAYLFEREGEQWHQAAKVHRESPGKNDMAGVAVALDGALAVIGAPGADAAGSDSGAALVYERSADGWKKVVELTPESAGERFGSAVAVDGDRILVGASGNVPAKDSPGSAYLFERNGGQWQQAARLTPSDGAGGDGFGDAVALAGDRALVGARFADLGGSDEGAAYVFEQDGESWREIAKLTAPEPSDRDQFGHAVALADDLAVVGAPRVDEPERDTGAAWAFAPGEEDWILQKRLAPSTPGAYDRFGTALGAGGGLIVVGAPEDIPEDAEGEVVTGTATLFANPR
ncbi:FG-GAP repeat protein [Wenzhouxiangella sp. EGI_FJ10305]|uniref:FG-GAP repeat protein n=1 Tax=Wenzhouxiangella sp. EGI_FJ10305 TaxID=3243768 RepID=UPI0035D89931